MDTRFDHAPEDKEESGVYSSEVSRTLRTSEQQTIFSRSTMKPIPEVGFNSDDVKSGMKLRVEMTQGKTTLTIQKMLGSKLVGRAQNITDGEPGYKELYTLIGPEMKRHEKTVQGIQSATHKRTDEQLEKAA